MRHYHPHEFDQEDINTDVTSSSITKVDLEGINQTKIRRKIWLTSYILVAITSSLYVLQSVTRINLPSLMSNIINASSLNFTIVNVILNAEYIIKKRLRLI